jgi:hypothetical protein
VIAPKKRRTRKENLSSMSTDELWAHHQKVAAMLVARITAEKEVIEDRLRLLDQVRGAATGKGHTLTNSTLRSDR